MSHAPPTKVTIEIVDNARYCQITFFGPTLNPDGAAAVYPLEDIPSWVQDWLEHARPTTK